MNYKARTFGGSTSQYVKKENKRGVKIYKPEIQTVDIKLEIQMMKSIPQKFFLTVPIYSWRYPSLEMFDADDDLDHFLWQVRSNPRFNDIITYVLTEVSNGCLLLNSLNICHGDLHAGNIVFVRKYPNDIFPYLYFVDWGYSNYYLDDFEATKKHELICKFQIEKTAEDEDYFEDHFFRRPFKGDYEYDWYFFIYNLILAYPILRTHSFFSPSTFIALECYINRYKYYDKW